MRDRRFLIGDLVLARLDAAAGGYWKQPFSWDVVFQIRVSVYEKVLER